jgi:hypothetical protein
MNAVVPVNDFSVLIIDILTIAGGVVAYSSNSVDVRSFQGNANGRSAALKSSNRVEPLSKRGDVSFRNHRKSLMAEAVDIMDKQFEVLEDDEGEGGGHRNRSAGFAWPQVSALLFFTGDFICLAPLFSLMLIFGTASLPGAFGFLTFMFYGSSLSALVLGEWSRGEELQAIMNHFDGLKIKWFNYLPFLLDLFSLSFASFDRVLLTPYLPSGDMFSAIFNAWAAFYSPDLLIEYFAISNYSVGVLMNIILIIVSILACLNFASKMVR